VAHSSNSHDAPWLPNSLMCPSKLLQETAHCRNTAQVICADTWHF